MMPKRMVKAGLGMFLLGLTAVGCNALPRGLWPVAADGVDVEAVLEYYRKAASLKPVAVRKEIDRLQTAYGEQPNDRVMFRLVTLALQPGRPSSDRRLAFDLLKEFRRRGRGDSHVLTMAALLEQQLAEQLRLVSECDEARRRARELEGTSRELRDKLQALENIEKILRQREK